MPEQGGSIVDAIALERSASEIFDNRRRDSSAFKPDAARPDPERASERPGMKVLLISSYRISCGIAAFTETLETLLDKDFDVTVFALDQSIVKSRIPHVVEAGDRLIRSSARASRITTSSTCNGSPGCSASITGRWPSVWAGSSKPRTT